MITDDLRLWLQMFADNYRWWYQMNIDDNSLWIGWKMMKYPVIGWTSIEYAGLG